MFDWLKKEPEPVDVPPAPTMSTKKMVFVGIITGLAVNLISKKVLKS